MVHSLLLFDHVHTPDCNGSSLQKIYEESRATGKYTYSALNLRCKMDFRRSKLKLK